MKSTFLTPESGGGGWKDQLQQVVEMMREMSLQTDAQEMVHAYARRAKELMRIDGVIALSRRDLERPRYRITRSSLWQEEINPWTQKERLPLLEGGLLGELIYADEPRIINDLRVPPDDPAAEHLAGYRSLMTTPNFDQGVALNLVVFLRREPNGFDWESLPEWVWRSNLFGRATHNLVLSAEVRNAYELLDRELKVVGDIQRSLLPRELPNIPTLELGAYYQTSRQTGGDYYDFFPLPDGRWGIFIADVSGHGTPATVMMAITHTIAHSLPKPPTPPGEMLCYVNDSLTRRYTGDSGTFVTAFYGVYDPKDRGLVYASAGHNPPRLRRADGEIVSLCTESGIPLGIALDETYREETRRLRRGDLLLFYTDGVTEAFDPDGEMFGVERLDAILQGECGQASHVIDCVLASLRRFTRGHPLMDDCTLLAARVA